MIAMAPALRSSAKLLQLYGTKYGDLVRQQRESAWTSAVELVAQELLVAVRSAEMLRAVFNETPLQVRFCFILIHSMTEYSTMFSYYIIIIIFSPLHRVRRGRKASSGAE